MYRVPYKASIQCQKFRVWIFKVTSSDIFLYFQSIALDTAFWRPNRKTFLSYTEIIWIHSQYLFTELLFKVCCWSACHIPRGLLNTSICSLRCLTLIGRVDSNLPQIIIWLLCPWNCWVFMCMGSLSRDRSRTRLTADKRSNWFDLCLK